MTPPEPPRPRGRRPQAWTTGDPNFVRPPLMQEHRWLLCRQILWAIALDGNGSFRGDNATAQLRAALANRGITPDSITLGAAVKDLATGERWNGILGREMFQKTTTRALWLTVTPDQLPPNPFLDEPANLPAVIETEPEVKVKVARRPTKKRTTSNGHRAPVDEPALPEGLTMPEAHLPEMTNSEELSLAISLIANVITRDAVNAGAAMAETTMQVMQENMALKAEMARKDARIRDLVLTVQRMRSITEPVSV